MHATICDMITDLVQNAIEANATQISLTVEETAEALRIIITDNGKGMSAEIQKKATDPFYTDGQKHRHRKVGLGLPFLFQTAEATGGVATIKSKEGEGTTVSFKTDPTHVDLPEFGNFISTAVHLMSYGFEGNLHIKRSANNKNYAMDKNELTEALGDLSDTDNLMLLRQFIEANEEELNLI